MFGPGASDTSGYVPRLDRLEEQVNGSKSVGCVLKRIADLEALEASLEPVF